MSVLRRACSKMAVVAAAALHSALLAQLRILLPSRTVGQLWSLIFQVIQRAFPPSFCKPYLIVRQGWSLGRMVVVKKDFCGTYFLYIIWKN